MEVRADHSSRLSFCCAECRKRTTSMSVRFLGRRVYLALAVVLVSASRADTSGGAAGHAVGCHASHDGALASVVVRAIPADAAVASGVRSIHATAAHAVPSWRIA
jgi:hypothetical protein